MKLGRLNHVGIVTPSVAEAFRFYREVMRAQVFREPVDLPDGSVRIGFVETPNGLIELIEPLDDSSPVADFLKANPLGGQHHLCFEVPDILSARAWFTTQKVNFASPIMMGVLGHPIFFIEAESMGGVFTEIIEIPPADATPG